MQSCVFLDRDGIINGLVADPRSQLPESPLSPADVILMPGAIEALHRLKAAGFALVVVSNQPAAAKGLVAFDELLAVHERVVQLLEEGGVTLDGYRYCFHHPDGTDPALGVACKCRKPGSGLLLEAASNHCLDLESSWMIGDTDSDVGAGLAAGCQVILVETPDSAHKRHTSNLSVYASASSLLGATDIVLKEETE